MPVVFHSRIPAVTVRVREAASLALRVTADDIVSRTQARMVPGYFYLTGLSKEQTKTEVISETEVHVHIDTPYAGFVELGTVHMAPKPVLLPSIVEAWPATFIETFVGDLR